MALPRLDAPQYDLTLYNGDNIKFRPFLVKEQKLLLLALEENDQNHVLNAMKQIISNCIFDQVDVNDLPTFEIENIFLRLREKSVGEQIDLRLMCTDDECKGQTPYTLDLTEIKYNMDDVPSKTIQISTNVYLNMRYPTMSNVEDINNLENVEDNFKFLASCIESIEADGNVYSTDTTSKEEIQTFIESMTVEQFDMLKKFFTTLPKLSKDLEYTCVKCGNEQKRVISGIQSFLA